ncbi:hypothetical protein KKH36_02555 [Patescibacteria group bacterium]|nr:hypothetical protein [Patescibacteria group bacterium]
MSETEVGKYNHLNKDDKFTVGIDLEEVVRQIVKKNYGTHRLLSSLVKVLDEKRGHGDPLSDGIRRLLDEGLC